MTTLTRLGRMLVTTTFLLAWDTSRAAAQDQVELWSSFGWWGGKDGAAFKPGGALGASYIADIRWLLDVGGDIGFGRFNYVVNADRQEELAEFQVSMVVRRWVGSRAHTRPFVGARLGYTRLSVALTDVQLEQNGLLVGPVVGIVIPTGNRLSPTISFEALKQNYSDVRVYLEGQNLPETSMAPWRYFVKVGLTFGSGWKRKAR